MAKAKHTTDEDLDLLAKLGVDTEPTPVVKRSPREERIIAGFEEIERFVEEQGHLPQHGEECDIFERLYAVRLDRLRESAECRELLTPLDSQGLLEAIAETSLPLDKELDDEALLAELGIDATAENDVTQLTHVRSRQEIKAAEEIAQRTPCKDFKQFKSIFQQVQQDLDTGVRQTVKYQDNAAINQGDLFVLDGQKVLVADMGEEFIADYGRPNAELRVIYDNGTESDLLLRSLQRALNKDKTSRRITRPESEYGPLFGNTAAEDDVQTGTIYVLRSLSDNPFIAEHREIIHKIGVTGGDVKKRVANAKKDPTYLLADVEVVAEFKLMNIDRRKLENLLHKLFDLARLDVELQDRFGISVKPKEWFFVPLGAINEAVSKIQDGTLDRFHYDPETAKLVRSQ
ncbi:GIY-YIG nuclease family protein [Oscillatoria sp. CS-180]|uniref:GIY-YIG nuclease family protein n=1 Tax=Oscillatoria sp. CS-180 TaxID=3021720 RepID=UPI00232F437B|nr:GIY-YIG nuclease family protein [Oscillatoria sp. CS-180]MDB9529462.1 GIY-YIG nuclease family protein [Oscillatoria sp. CS-180]